MSARPEIVFLFNLIQDVNIQRGLVHLAAAETDAGLRFLVSAAFLKRDRLRIWQKELTALAAETGAEIHVFADLAQVHAVLQGRGGMIFAASESHLDAHRETRDTFRIAPPAFLKVTLQHGLECVGFLQSREHVIGHGRDIAFNADVVCGWLEPDRLTSLTAQSRGKLYVTGPPTLLQTARRHPDHPPEAGGGIVCENMHSVRLSASGNHRASFMDIFFHFCRDLAGRGRQVTLRPHPGGQYVLKHNVALPDNVRLNNLPIYHVNLPGYAYGISAPSTIVLDMVLAGIPVGVWRDPGGVMDAGNYDGLTEIAGLEDWRAFERDAQMRPQMLLDRQRRFLDGLGMVLDRAEIRRRFARLMVNGLAATAGPLRADTAPMPEPAPEPVAAPAPAAPPAPLRILFLADEGATAPGPAFLTPLAPLQRSKEIEIGQLSERWFIGPAGQEPAPAAGGDTGGWMTRRLAGAGADVIVCSGYNGAYIDRLAETAARHGIPIVLHAQAAFLERLESPSASRKKRRAAEALLAAADLVFADTPALKRRLHARAPRLEIAVRQVAGGPRILRRPQPAPVRRIGLVGPDAAALDLLAPPLARYLDRNPAVTLDILAPRTQQTPLHRFGDRIVLPGGDAADGLAGTALARDWDIALVPGGGGPAAGEAGETAWRALAACGVAMLTPAADRSRTGRWRTVAPGGWDSALQELTDRPADRYRLALQAQARMLMRQSDARQRAEILALLRRAQDRIRDRAIPRPDPAGTGPEGLIEVKERLA